MVIWAQRSRWRGPWLNGLDSLGVGFFISYRREETAYPAGWLYDRLADRFGGQVFKDVDSIELGDDFVETITSSVGSCDVLLALISDQWVTITDKDGRRRLDNPEDFVRLEIEAALTRNVRVIPILVGGARTPRAADLPPSLARLVRRQALELSPARFDFDTSRLLGVLDQTLVDARTAQGGYDSVTETAPVTSPEIPAAVESTYSLVEMIQAVVRDTIRPGRVMFNPPAEMRQGRRERIEVAIARSRELDDQLRENLRGRGIPVLEDISTSPFMAVALQGAGFDITPLSATDQLVGPTARWEFDVVPRHAGNRIVQLLVSMRIGIPGRPDERVAIPVFEHSIHVRVDPVYGTRQFLGQNWQWLSATILGLGGAIGAWLQLIR
jgi:hypothetical protein